MAKFSIGSYSGLTVNAVVQKDSDDTFWNGSTNAWQAGAYNNLCTWDSDMLHYAVTIDHADFNGVKCKISFIESAGALLGQASVDAGLIRYQKSGTDSTKSGVD